MYFLKRLQAAFASPAAFLFRRTLLRVGCVSSLTLLFTLQTYR
jgi:hypothetical protein